MAFNVRSAAVVEGTPGFIFGGKKEIKEGTPEIDYVKLINSNLPPDIRVTAWAAVPVTFDAR